MRKAYRKFRSIFKTSILKNNIWVSRVQEGPENVKANKKLI